MVPDLSSESPIVFSCRKLLYCVILTCGSKPHCAQGSFVVCSHVKHTAQTFTVKHIEVSEAFILVCCMIHLLWSSISGIFNAWPVGHRWPTELFAVVRRQFWKNNYKRNEIKSNFNDARWPLSYTAVFWIVRSFLNLQRTLWIWYFTNM